MVVIVVAGAKPFTSTGAVLTELGWIPSHIHREHDSLLLFNRIAQMKPGALLLDSLLAKTWPTVLTIVSNQRQLFQVL